MENVETQGLARGPQSVGKQLRAAREAAGKTRSDIATHTKIAERHLAALEDDRLGDLAARTYAVGFARAYARAVGLDERQIAAKVREQLDQDTPDRPQTPPSFEPGDPARVPTRRVAWGAALGVVAVVVVLLVFWSNYLSPEGELPELVAEKTATPANRSAARAVPSPQAAASTGPVVLTATGDRVWVKVTDANGAQVLQKELAKGESWAAPGEVAGLELRTGRPDALQITVGGKAIPRLRPNRVSYPACRLPRPICWHVAIRLPPRRRALRRRHHPVLWRPPRPSPSPSPSGLSVGGTRRTSLQRRRRRSPFCPHRCSRLSTIFEVRPPRQACLTWATPAGRLVNPWCRSRRYTAGDHLWVGWELIWR
ncbi:helix-turn-helix domain-containing protein [Novosphingobium panipatense]